jgi:putative transcriptional regulator
MLRLRVAKIMRERGISAYALGKGAGLNYATAYRLSRSDEFGRLRYETLNRLCEFFQVQPGELIEWVPDKKRGRR